MSPLARRRGAGETKIPALGPPGPNPLFFGVLTAVVLGCLGFGLAGDADLLESNLIFRAVVGLFIAGVGYLVVAALWLAWHRLIFRRIIGPGGAGAEAPDPSEISRRDQEITEFMDKTTKAVEEMATRLERLEKER